MKPEQMTETLEQAAAQLGVQVRYDTMTGDAAGGGVGVAGEGVDCAGVVVVFGEGLRRPAVGSGHIIKNGEFGGGGEDVAGAGGGGEGGECEAGEGVGDLGLHVRVGGGAEDCHY